MSEKWFLKSGLCVIETEVASSGAEKRKGLLGREGLEPGRGLLIPGCRSIHTFFMQFPIDVVYLDDGMKVCRIRKAMKPFRLSCFSRADMVLELAAGEAERCGISEGSVLERTSSE